MGTVTREINQNIHMRYAILIGNDSTKNEGFPRLDSIHKGLKKMNTLLSNQSGLNYEITQLINPDAAELRICILDISRRANSDDFIFLYYSGHGILDNDKSFYFLCSDSKPQFIEATCVESDFVLSMFCKSLCQNFFILIDASFSGALFNNVRKLPKGMVAITACGEDENTSDEVEGGVFSQTLFKGLESDYIDSDRDGKITITNIYEYFLKTTNTGKFVNSSPKKWEWNIDKDIVLINTPKLVFISYQRMQKDLVNNLSNSLKEYQIATFVDEEKIKIGDNWRTTLEDTIKNCRAFIFILDKKILDSEVATWEIETAHKYNVPILPIVINNTKPHAMFEKVYGEYNRLNYNPKDHDKFIKTLVSHISKTEIQNLRVKPESR